MMKSGNNLFERLNPSEFRSMRRRIISCILATDMANHNSHMIAMKSKLDSLEIKNGSNLDKLLIEGDLAKNEEVRQMILSECVHTADLSNPAKNLEVFKKWTNIVYMEFWIQGDIEKENGLTISNFCDRKTTNVNNCQVGFINFVVFPQFEMMGNLMPEISIYLDNIKANLKFCEENAIKEKERSLKLK
jgi:hypothetical protein